MNYLNIVKLSLKTTFHPPGNATAHQIRLYGLGSWLIGFLTMVVLSLTISVLEEITLNNNLGIIYISIYFISFGLMVVGCYRALTGKKTSIKVDDYEVSYIRVIIGVLSYLLSIMIPTSIILLFLYFLQWIGIEPNKFF